MISLAVSMANRGSFLSYLFVKSPLLTESQVSIILSRLEEDPKFYETEDIDYKEVE